MNNIQQQPGNYEDEKLKMLNFLQPDETLYDLIFSLIPFEFYTRDK